MLENRLHLSKKQAFCIQFALFLANAGAKVQKNYEL